MATLAEVAILQAITDDVTALAQADAARALRQVDLGAIRAERPRLEREVGDVIYGYGYGLSALAADWYADARFEAPVTGRFTPAPSVSLTDRELSALVGWSLGPLFDVDHPDIDLAVARLDGGVQKQVANSARRTITENVARDPAKASWYRGASSNCCSFCLMLTTRIYTRRASADFSAHDHDRCFPVPTWSGTPSDLPPYYADFQEDYDRAATAAREAGEAVTAKNVLRRIRQATGRK